MNFDAKTDLIFERHIDITPEEAFRAWTDPALLPIWFCPKPWFVSDCVCDLRAGGRFFSIFHGPNGELFNSEGSYLEVIKNEKLVWTDMLSEDFKPQESGFFVGVITFTPDGKGGTYYKAIARHKSEADRIKHEERGFKEGWGLACDQMIELMKSL